MEGNIKSMADEGAQTPQVLEEFGVLSRINERLVMLVAALEGKLIPVLRPPSTNGGNGSATAMPKVSKAPLAAAIEEETDALVGSCDILEQLLKRLEV